MFNHQTPYAKNLRLVLGEEWVELLEDRGFDYMEFIDARHSVNEGQIKLTHPINWMTEEEIDNMKRWRDF